MTTLRTLSANLGPLTTAGTVPGITASIQSLRQVNNDITGGLGGSVGAASDDFGSLGQHNELESEQEFESESNDVNDDNGSGGHGRDG